MRDHNITKRLTFKLNHTHIPVKRSNTKVEPNIIALVSEYSTRGSDLNSVSVSQHSG